MLLFGIGRRENVANRGRRTVVKVRRCAPRFGQTWRVKPILQLVIVTDRAYIVLLQIRIERFRMALSATRRAGKQVLPALRHGREIAHLEPWAGYISQRREVSVQRLRYFGRLHGKETVLDAGADRGVRVAAHPQPH